jgi:DNA-binding HxlR family transcriptional regulator
MDKTPLVNLCSRGWSLRTLALLADGCPARVSPLASRAGCGRTAMGATVAHLVALGLLENNPGYGHPLRAHYRLTAMGEILAQWALMLEQLLPGAQHREVVRGKWVLPVIGNLTRDQRYSSLKKELSPVTDRALSACLGRLSEHQWIERAVSVESAPPAVSYRTLEIGQAVHEHVLRLPQPIII